METKESDVVILLDKISKMGLDEFTFKKVEEKLYNLAEVTNIEIDGCTIGEVVFWQEELKNLNFVIDEMLEKIGTSIGQLICDSCANDSQIVHKH